MTLKVHTAKKDHLCWACSRRIPAGSKYYRDYEDGDGFRKDLKEHTNCLLYENEKEYISEYSMREELKREGK